MQALLGRTSEARWLRYAHAQLRHLFPYLPQQPGYNKRLRRLADTLRWLIGMLARDTQLRTDDVWVADSTPVECARSRETVHRSALAGWAEYGCRAGHSSGMAVTSTSTRNVTPAPPPRRHSTAARFASWTTLACCASP